MNMREEIRRILVTGGCGFVGSHLVRRLLRTADVRVTNLDLLTYAGRLDNLRDVATDPRYRFVHGDITDAEAVRLAADHCDAIINAAAETHVDRSIIGGDEFVLTNVLGTQRLLDHAVNHGMRFVQVSTDEVYGDVNPPRRSVETDPLVGSSPYAAVKAAADLLVLAYVRTFELDASIVRGANAYGPNQHPEKLIPLMTIHALRGQRLPVYGDGQQVREYTFVDDFASGIETVLRAGAAGDAYNCGSASAQVNLDTVRAIVDLVGADPSLIIHVGDRPGHDRRYALDSTKLMDLGWEPQVGFAQGLARTVSWYSANCGWWQEIIADDAYAAYTASNYTNRGDA